MTNHAADGDIVIVPLTGSLAITAVGRMSAVVAGIRCDYGDQRLPNDPRVRSESQVTESGNVSLAVEGAASIGKRGQQRATETLRETLEAKGHVVSVRPGVDADGEDAILVIGDRTYTLQVVTTPGMDDFWHQASIGSAQSDVDAAAAADWMRARIEAKALKHSPGERPRTVYYCSMRGTPASLRTGAFFTTTSVASRVRQVNLASPQCGWLDPRSPIAFAWAAACLRIPAAGHCATVNDWPPAGS